MKGLSVLAVAICVACFFIGYLAYVATTLLVEAVMPQVQTCQDAPSGCTLRETESATR
jgi:hypothetical protein